MTHLKCEGHADISHNELVLLQVGTKLDKGELDVRGGVIAGAVLIENIQGHGKEGNVIFTVHFTRDVSVLKCIFCVISTSDLSLWVSRSSIGIPVCMYKLLPFPPTMYQI